MSGNAGYVIQWPCAPVEYDRIGSVFLGRWCWYLGRAQVFICVPNDREVRVLAFCTQAYLGTRRSTGLLSEVVDSEAMLLCAEHFFSQGTRSDRLRDRAVELAKGFEFCSGCMREIWFSACPV